MMRSNQIAALLLIGIFTMGICLPVQAISAAPIYEDNMATASTGGINPGDEGWKGITSQTQLSAMSETDIKTDFESSLNDKRRTLSVIELGKCPNVKIYDISKFNTAFSTSHVNTDMAGYYLSNGIEGCTYEPGNNSLGFPITKTLVLVRPNPEPSLFNSCLLHEFVHAVEIINKDHLNPSAGNKAWDERNIDYMDYGIEGIQDHCPPFEKAVKANDFNGAKELWNQLVAHFNYRPEYFVGNSSADKHVITADPYILEQWFGYRVELEDIERFYRNDAPQQFKDFFDYLDNCPKPAGQTVIFDGMTPGHAWSTITVGLDGVSDLQSEKVEGWRNNGASFTCNANADQPIRISGTIEAISGISYYDYTTVISVGSDYGQSPTISVNGGSVNFEYTFVPAEHPGVSQFQVYASCTGGNPDFFTYYVDGTVNINSSPAADDTNSPITDSFDSTNNNGQYQVASDPYHPNVFINGIQQFFDVPAQVINERTLVPLRGIFEAFGAQFNWDQATQGITAFRGNDVIELWVGSAQAYVNGISTILDVPAMAMDGRTLVPLRFIAESLGAQASYDPNTKSVYISDTTDTSDTSDTEDYSDTIDTPETTDTPDTSDTPVNSGLETILLKLTSASGVSSNPPNKTTFTLSSESTITKIWTYHYNNGAGERAGTIGLRNVDTDEVIGTWNVIGRSISFDGEPGAVWPLMSSSEPHLYWGVQPNVTIPAGTYEVVDSSPATWSYNSDMGNMGCAWVFGIPQ